MDSDPSAALSAWPEARTAAARLAGSLALPSGEAAERLETALSEASGRLALGEEELARLGALLGTFSAPEPWEGLEAAPPPEALADALARVALQSEFVAEAAAADSARARLLLEAAAGAPRLRELVPLAALREELARFDALDEVPAREAASRAKTFHSVRVALRDLLGLADIETMMVELSDLAQAQAEFAHRWHEARLAERHGRPMLDEAEAGRRGESAFCVVLMGKGGGRELNFSSDIDLLFVYEGEGWTEGVEDPASGKKRREISCHEFFNKLARKIIAFLGEPGLGGPPPYRVDMRLRPEGDRGPLARGLTSYRSYFAAQADHWERVAYAKARAVAGPPRFAREVESAFRDFVFSEFFDAGILREIARLKGRIDAEAAAGDLAWRDVKRGRGGIRELEFLLAGLQLLYAREHPELARRRSSVWLIDGLMSCGLMDADVGRRLREAYLLLRRAEQRLQIRRDRQTHLLAPRGGPGEIETLRVLRPEDPEGLLAELEEARAFVAGEFRKLFGEDAEPGQPILPLLDLFAEPPGPESDARLLEALEPRGLGTRETLAALRRLRDGTGETYQTRQGKVFFEAVAPGLLRVAARVPDPSGAVVRLADFLERAKSAPLYLELLAEAPKAVEMLLRLFGTGQRLSGVLLRRPELIDLLVSDGTLLAEAPAPDCLASLRRALKRSRTLDAQKRSLRRLVQQFELQAGARLALGLDPLAETHRRLTDLARAGLKAGLEQCWADLREERGGAAPFASETPEGFAVLGLGKLASGELTFLSDLDVVFVAREGCPPAEMEEFARLAARLIDLLGDPTIDGRAWEVDARLRPMGRDSPLACSADALEEYFRHDADVWEFLAFVRLGVSAGDETLGQRAADGVARAFAGLPSRDGRGGGTLREQVASMRARLAASAKEKKGWRDLKRGPGGLVALEFSWQMAACAEAAAGETPPPGARPGESLLKEWLGEEGFAEAEEGLLFLRTLETLVRLARDRPESLVPVDEGAGDDLSRALAVAANLPEGASGLAAGLEQNEKRREQLFESALHGFQREVASLAGPR